MLFETPLLAFAPPSEHARIDALRAGGFRLNHHVDQDSLYAGARQVPNAGGTVAILMGASAQNRNAAVWLREAQPSLGLIAMLQTGTEEEQMALIQAGVDWICPVGASNDLLITMLLSLWKRRMAHKPADDGSRQCGDWSLVENGWTLKGPEGRRVGLTVSERALLMTLFEAPGLSASYEELLAAVNHALGSGPEADRKTRVGVMISRLRKKCQRQGVVLPIRSMQNQGYVFVPEALSDGSD